MYNSWKSTVIGKKTLTVQGVTNPFGVECTTIAWSWAATCFPDESFVVTLGSGDAKTLFASASPNYFNKITAHTPQQGDIAVYGPTPTPGYTNQFDNPFGHTGVVDSFDANGVTLVQQDGSEPQLPCQAKYRPYSLAPLIGLLRPKGNNMQPVPTRDQVISSFKTFINQVPTEDQIAHYMQPNQGYAALNGDLLQYHYDRNPPINTGDMDNIYLPAIGRVANDNDKAKWVGTISWKDFAYDTVKRPDFAQQYKVVNKQSVETYISKNLQ